MPIYTYRAKKDGCSKCKEGFDTLQRVNDNPLDKCPWCDAIVERIFSPFSVGFSRTSFERRTKEKGFHKLKRVDKGKYEKIY